jgi:hypothetical protein
LIYKFRDLTPEDFLHFVETDEFGDDWQALGLGVENDLWALQMLIMSAPERAPVVSGTGGLRKMRFAPESWNRGKRGAVRVCYAYFPTHWTVLLIMAYGKGRKENLSPAEKKAIKGYLVRVERWLDLRNY